MQFIYMGIIRTSVQSFVDTHNKHRIRHQKQRSAYLPTGRPLQLYRHPPTGVHDYAGKPVDFILHELLEEVSEYDLDGYLTDETYTLCCNILRSKGLPIQYSFADDHVASYLTLRTGLLQHFQTVGGEIQILAKPTGAMQWIEQQNEMKLEMERFQQLKEEERDFILYRTDEEEWEICNNYNKGKERQLEAINDVGNVGASSTANFGLDVESDIEDSDDDGIVLLL